MVVLVVFSGDLSINSGSNIRGRLICEGLIHWGVKVGVLSLNVPLNFNQKSILFFKINSGLELSLRNTINQLKPDIIYSITESQADIVSKVAGEHRCKFACDIHGIGIIEILELGKGYGNRIKRISASFKWLRSLRNAQIITVANPTLINFLRLVYGRKKIIPIIGMTDISLFSPVPGKKNNFENGKLRVLYSGNFHKWQGITILMKVIRKLINEKSDVEFTIIASSYGNNFSLDKWNDVLKHPNVKVFNCIDYQDISSYYNNADVLIIPRPWMLSTYFAFPQKLGDYMASGKLIIATDLAPHRWALMNPTCGILCAPNVNRISDAIKSVSKLEDREIIKNQAREKATLLFDHINQAKIIQQAFMKLIDE